jgi:hypothetical protein
MSHVRKAIQQTMTANTAMREGVSLFADREVHRIVGLSERHPGLSVSSVDAPEIIHCEPFYAS